jgi:hypothetical protein
MARIRAILKALFRALWRDQQSYRSVTANNFFFTTVLFLADAGGFIYLIIGLVLLFPLSTDPLRKIPASRLDLWPLDAADRRVLRVVSPWLNPVTWLVAGLAVWAARGKLSIGLWASFAGIVLGAFLVSSFITGRGFGSWRHLPHFPGRLNHLVRKNLREMLGTLDFYCALALSVSALLYRLLGPPLPREALMAMTFLVVIALSSYAQCLFGLDGAGGLARYRLLPIPVWQILLAKDAAYLLLVIPLTLPLDPLAGAGAALVSLAFGHGPSLDRYREQKRWRFTSGASLVYGIVQSIAIAMAASTIFSSSPWVFLICAAVWLGSLAWFSRQSRGLLA